MKKKQLPWMLRIPPRPGQLMPGGDTRTRNPSPGDDVIQEVAQKGAVTATSGPYVPDRHTGDQNGIPDNQW